MAHYTLIASVSAGDGEFPYVNVQFSKNHRPIPIEGATYYLCPGSRGRRTPIRIGKDVNAARPLPTNCGLSSITEHSFHGITPSPKGEKV